MEEATKAQLFVSSYLTWFPDNVDLAIAHLDSNLNSNGNYPDKTIQWRTAGQTGPDGNIAPVNADRLIRWDTRSPQEVFRHGFKPEHCTQPDTDPRTLTNEYSSLSEQVDWAEATVFVRTVRHYFQDGQYVRWMPTDPTGFFEYEIYTFGGIDVNRTLGKPHTGNYNRWKKREISFPGGISRLFVRSARQYNAGGQVTKLWVNNSFDMVPVPPLMAMAITGAIESENIEFDNLADVAYTVDPPIMDSVMQEGDPMVDQWM